MAAAAGRKLKMSFLKARTNLDRILRIPKRLGQDLRTIMIAKNWQDIVKARLNGGPLKNIELRDGTRLESPPEVSLLFLFNEIWMDKIYELGGYEIEDEDTIIDIGGNIGAFAVFAASRANNVKIRSYEPFPENAEYLRKNIAASKLNNVTVVEKAVAGKPGTRSLHIDDSWVKHSLSVNNGETGLSVGCTTLDEIIGEIKHCDLLKIDCEGGEYEIFYQADPASLKQIDKIICEYHDGPQGTGEELKNFFEANSFKTDMFKSFDDATGLICVKNLR